MENKNSKIPGIEWYKSFEPKHSKKLEILQFNDVYNIDEKQNNGGEGLNIKAGSARFIEAFNQYGSDKKLVSFSGDLFSPSRCK